jgi:two-component system sensor histidine kinase HydH
VIPFIGGVILTLLIGAPIVVALHRRLRQANVTATETAGPDEELARLTGELAHEIKNPLSTIKVNLALTRESLDAIDFSEPHAILLQKGPPALAGAARKIAVVQKETDRLEQILDGFLRYIRRPELQLASADLNELVGDMIDFYSPQAYSHRLRMRHCLAEAPLICRVDAAALKQVLLNLFINAQQASDSGGELMIRTLRRGAIAIVQVSDTGRGIPAERLALIFRPYASSRSGGMGLGLATAKKIVEAHGGTISVHSEVGKGTSFTIEIPLERTNADKPDGPGSEAPENPRFEIRNSKQAPPTKDPTAQTLSPLLSFGHLSLFRTRPTSRISYFVFRISRPRWAWEGA